MLTEDIKKAIFKILDIKPKRIYFEYEWLVGFWEIACSPGIYVNEIYIKSDHGKKWRVEFRINNEIFPTVIDSQTNSNEGNDFSLDVFNKLLEYYKDSKYSKIENLIQFINEQWIPEKDN